jgi:hypothetical protein
MNPKDLPHDLPVINIEQYGGKQVAIVDGKIAAWGRTWQSVLKKVRKKYPTKPIQEIRVLAVPKSLDVIYHAEIVPLSL